MPHQSSSISLVDTRNNIAFPAIVVKFGSAENIAIALPCIDNFFQLCNICLESSQRSNHPFLNLCLPREFQAPTLLSATLIASSVEMQCHAFAFFNTRDN
jgi:hypothetical protein